ncbi:MAG: flagellar basal body P-ring formation protein FlgA [Deltaproteobacteria bacterium]|nr:flagellar basal body P-ring formation protein FlgA [Deltaproteobacteria bacterium]
MAITKVKILLLLCFFFTDFSVFGANPEIHPEKTFVWLAQKKIYPGEKLNPNFCQIKEIDVSQGLEKEFKNNFLSKEVNPSTLEARQTILEGQVIQISWVQKIPDVRRGDVIQIKLISGGIVLTTFGTIEEPSYVNSEVKVLSAKTKRLLSGTLINNKVVEVRL